MKVFQMNECDWYMAESKEQAIECYSKDYGAECVEFTAELTKDEMDSLGVRENLDDPDCMEISFSEQLSKQTKLDNKTPRLFATCEF